ncbi:DNA damage-inducible protein 1 [Malassezia sp. CBS 17886]|nr:DNA damage-inducible protein 1 [Malassezia sp. CBS 17886]
MITVVDREQRTYAIDADVSIELENFKAILEADSGVPSEFLRLQHQGRELSDGKAALAVQGVKDEDMLVLVDMRTTASLAATSSHGMADGLQRQIQQNPALMQQLRSANPELADAVTASPGEFARLFELQRQQMSQFSEYNALASADPFDVDAQRRIEEAIRQERVAENMEHAMEHSPESFGNVTMLYVDLKVNAHHVKAFYVPPSQFG